MFDGVYHVNHLSSDRHNNHGQNKHFCGQPTKKLQNSKKETRDREKVGQQKREIIKKKLSSVVKRYYFQSYQMTLDFFARGCGFDLCPGRTFLERVEISEKEKF
uniref:Uncharacterized protein n=1 Tax=Cacopsylla melanoneura TaxID=428564 RepID=A0A8D8V544_9HEMI